jgi:hypothetical protein
MHLLLYTPSPQVRVFQFSAKPRAIECVMFDSVGGANNNATTPIEEPPGFQLRLLSTIHSAHICASTYMPTCKLVAVSDAAGAVSLIDLAKPAIRWVGHCSDTVIQRSPQVQQQSSGMPWSCDPCTVAVCPPANIRCYG